MKMIGAGAILVTYLGAGVGFLYKFAQALFAKKDNGRNMLISMILYAIFTIIYQLSQVLV